MDLRRDLPASLVVFLIAVPLSLGIALASGAPVIAGLIGAVAGGIVTGLLAGSPLQVSGPAAGLTVVVFGLVQQLGWEVVCLATACAGGVQLLLGFLKVARGALVIAPSVVHGMLAGIGISIALAQAHVLLGGSPASSPLANLIALPARLGALNLDATILGVLTIAVLVVWKKLPWPAVRAIPGPLVAVVLGTAVSLVAKMDVKRVDLPETLAFTQLKLPTEWGAFLVAVLTLAVIASIETLLCVEATDRLDPQKRITPTNRELKAQGLGNIVSGLLGGLPVTQVIVRSSANITFGGRTKLSAILHGVLILVCVAAIPGVLNLIPLATLASILCVVGCKLAKPALFAAMYRHGWEQFMPFVATVVGILATDLLRGIGIGLAVSVVIVLYHNLRNPFTLSQHAPGTNEYRIRLAEEVSFLNKGRILQQLQLIPAQSRVVIDATESKSLDFDVHEMLQDFCAGAPARNIAVELRGITFKAAI